MERFTNITVLIKKLNWLTLRLMFSALSLYTKSLKAKSKHWCHILKHRHAFK